MYKLISSPGRNKIGHISLATLHCDDDLKQRIVRAAEIRYIFDYMLAEYIIYDNNSPAKYMTATGFPEKPWLEKLANYCAYYLVSNPGVIADPSIVWVWMMGHSQAINQPFADIINANTDSVDISNELFDIESLINDTRTIQWLFCENGSKVGKYRSMKTNEAARTKLRHGFSITVATFALNQSLSIFEQSDEVIDEDTYRKIKQGLDRVYEDLLPLDENPRWTHTPFGKIYFHPSLLSIEELSKSKSSIVIGTTMSDDPVQFLRVMSESGETRRNKKGRHTWRYSLKNSKTMTLFGKAWGSDKVVNIDIGDTHQLLEKYIHLDGMETIKDLFEYKGVYAQYVDEVMGNVLRANLILRPIAIKLIQWYLEHVSQISNIERMPRRNDSSYVAPDYYREFCNKIASVDTVSLLGDLVFNLAYISGIRLSECAVSSLYPHVDVDILRIAAEYNQARHVSISPLSGIGDMVDRDTSDSGIGDRSDDTSDRISKSSRHGDIRSHSKNEIYQQYWDRCNWDDTEINTLE